ncbi:MAG TPA: alpha/beta fold hydrolase [Edaphobacter sp.]|nr:alpha/beta fold hydrolase [Edaphobacter sp.]
MVNRSADHDTPWLECLSDGRGAKLRLFCFPYAGGTTHMFREWQKYFMPQVELCLVHLPGRGKRFGERLFTRLNFLVDVIAQEIRDKLQTPFALYGHSMGALISFELCRELRRRYKIEPAHLFVSGKRAPHIMLSKPVSFNLPRNEFIDELRRLNGTSSNLLDHDEAMDLLLPVLRADFEMVETYEYHFEEPLSCPIAVYGGVQDERVPIEGLYAWKEHTSGDCKVRMFPGGHFFIQNYRNCNIDFVDVLRRDVLEALGLLR